MQCRRGVVEYVPFLAHACIDLFPQSGKVRQGSMVGKQGCRDLLIRHETTPHRPGHADEHGNVPQRMKVQDSAFFSLVQGLR